jgi:cytoskeletal protein RodZ
VNLIYRSQSISRYLSLGLIGAAIVLCGSTSVSAQTKVPTSDSMEYNSLMQRLRQGRSSSVSQTPTASVAKTPENSVITNTSVTKTPENLVITNTSVAKTPENLVNLTATDKKASSLITPVTNTAALNSTVSQFPVPVKSRRVAQADVDLGQRTRGGSSYVGVAGNIGFAGGTSALGDGNFTIISKIGLTRTFSARPSVILGDNTTILLPVTYDLSLKRADAFSEPLAIAPYIGGGAAIKTGDNSDVALLISGGVDIPINRQFTATAAVNAAFFDKTDVGLLIGIGYNFNGF